jgi:hypothetical protein
MLKKTVFRKNFFFKFNIIQLLTVHFDKIRPSKTQTKFLIDKILRPYF